jgi:hypothetical protein
MKNKIDTQRKAHAPLNGDSESNLEAVEGLHDAACCASSFSLGAWLDLNYGVNGACGFCDVCGEDWQDLPFGWIVKDIRGNIEKCEVIRYWVCSKECFQKISREIQIGTRYQKLRWPR